MPPAVIPDNDVQRVAALRDLHILDTEPSAAFDALAQAASLLCGTPIALISLVDQHRQWFKANIGLEGVTETPRDIAFCGHAILGDEIMEVPDARDDARFSDNPLVVADPNIRFYAGAPLTLSGGENVGTLCVIDHRPRRLDPRQLAILKNLAIIASQALRNWRSERLLTETADELRLSEEFLSRTGRLAGVGGWSIELDSNKIVWSAETYEILGVTRDYTPSVQTDANFYAPEAREPIAKALERTMTLGEPFNLELPFIRADGQKRWIRTIAELVRQAGAPDRLIGAFQDVTAQHELAAALAQRHELLKVTMHSIGDAVITTDGEGITTWMNPVAERLIGKAASDAVGQPLADIFVIVDEQTREPITNLIEISLERGGISPSQQKTLISHHGDEYGIEDSIAPIRNENAETVGAVVVFRDVTQQRRLTAELTFRATHDALTALLNRGECERRLTYLLHKVHADESQSAVLFIDLDRFKLVNDTCGHAAGDQLLVQVAKLFNGLVRASDSVARLGGDEFVILLDRCPVSNAQALAQKICDRMEQFRFSYNNERFRVGASIGLVTVDTSWRDIAAILHAADASCYAAKLGGRNRVHLWSETDEGIKSRDGQAQWAARLEQALDDDRFVLFAQRIHRCNGQGGTYAEILLRLRGPDGALLLPGAFMPAAERFHMATRIDRWVVSAALNWMRTQPNLHSIDMLAINLSGQSISDPEFRHWVLGHITEAGSHIGGRICLEITETAVVANLADAGLFIEQLQAIGVRVALDDFGSGASSFGYLKSMAVDFLKIDGQFIRDILTDKLHAVAVRCFIEVANVAGMQTIAEFTETAEILDGLRAMGIDYAQGYHIHRPAPIDELLASADQLAAE